MNGDLGRDKIWTAEIWGEVDKTVLAEAGRVRVAQKVFPSVQTPNAVNVSADVFGAALMRIDEGVTRPLLEISVEFTLTQGQIDNEATLKTGRTLAGLAAKSVAFTEDALFVQGSAVALPPGVTVSNLPSAGLGLLGIAANNLTLQVNPLNPANPNIFGDQTFTAVTQGISQLIARNQPGPYALLLESSIQADTYRPIPGTLATTADRIVPLVPGGFYATGTLQVPIPPPPAPRAAGVPPPVIVLAPPGAAPAKGAAPAPAAAAAPAPPLLQGILTSLGGEPTVIYIGVEATTAFTQKDTAGLYHFRVFERVQIVARDQQALVALLFQ